MIYIIAGVGVLVAILTAGMGIANYKADAYLAQRDQAVAANRALEASIKDVQKQCSDALGILAREQQAGEKRRAAALAEKAKVDKLAAGQREVIDKLLADIKAAPEGPAACQKAEEVLRRLAKDRNAP